MKNVTVAELGNKLPVKSKEGNRPSFVFKPWKMLEEKAIGGFKQKHQHLGRFVREVFDYMLVEYGGKEWKTIEKNQRTLLLSGQPWANIFYMWVYLRIDALGEDMKMSPFNCPACGNPINNFIADLNSMEVRIHGEKENEEDEDDPWEGYYKLKKPFDFGEIKVTGLKFGFTPWRAMESIKKHDKNEGSIKDAMLRASLIGATSEETGDEVLALDRIKVLENLSKRDIQGYYSALDLFNGGPRLAIEHKCDACGNEHEAALNWTYDYFFESSSL